VLGTAGLGCFGSSLLLIGTGTAPAAHAGGIPACPPGKVEAYLSQGGRYHDDDLVEQQAPATAVSAQAAFDKLPESQAIASGPQTRGAYCATFALVTDSQQHLGGESTGLKYTNTPMWVVYIGGVTLWPTGGAAASGPGTTVTVAPHTAEVWFMDATTGEPLFGTTVG
jgi:hypothetical protein